MLLRVIAVASAGTIVEVKRSKLSLFIYLPGTVCSGGYHGLTRKLRTKNIGG
jgi:hypothetical protein